MSQTEDAPSNEELAEVAQRFRDAQVKTLILDEAHHLRQAWWRALAKLVELLPDVHVISLTATPPFDVLGSEWTRYEELCGPITTEISVPELVKTKSLCPHQDYVHIVWAKSEASNVAEHDCRVELLLADLVSDPILLERVCSHRWIAAPSPDVRDILQDPESAFAMLIFLKAAGRTPPQPLLDSLGRKPSELPPWDRRWCQALLSNYLATNFESSDKKHRNELTRRLRRDGLLWRAELRITSSRAIERQLSLAEEKIEGCIQICHQEWIQRGDNLRQAILCDFILDDDFEGIPAATRRLGAWPLFRELIESFPVERAQRVALLTGRLTVVHVSLVEALGWAVDVTPLATHPDWCRVRSSKHLVSQVTSLLAAGSIQVLVGTRSLLGEGWDAPALNSLVLASYVGSYMMTNQMRGRVIRSDPQVADKVASIWHLAAVTEGAQSGRSDLDGLAERCRTFVGLNAERPVIESGIDRLAIATELKEVNEQMFARLVCRQELHERWAEAIASGVHGRVVPSIITPPQDDVRQFVFQRTLRYLLYPAIELLIGIVGVGLQFAVRAGTAKALAWVLIATAVIALAVTLPRVIRPFFIWLRHLPVDGSVRQIAEALRQALRDRSEIQGDSAFLTVGEYDDGTITVALIDAPFNEQQLFTDALSELLGPIENPRYLIVREERGAIDYHAVPRLLAASKEGARALQRTWESKVGPSELIYTRTTEGRKLLLKARAAAFATALANPAERRDQWQ